MVRALRRDRNLQLHATTRNGRIGLCVHDDEAHHRGGCADGFAKGFAEGVSKGLRRAFDNVALYIR